MALNSTLQRLRSLLTEGQGGREGHSGSIPWGGVNNDPGPPAGGWPAPPGTSVLNELGVPGFSSNARPRVGAPANVAPVGPLPPVTGGPRVETPDFYGGSPANTGAVAPAPAPIAALQSPGAPMPTAATVPPPPPMDNRPFQGGPYIPARPDSTVTAGSVLPDASPGPRVSFAGPGQPNVNYDDGGVAGAARTASQFGGQLNEQDLGGDYGPAGPPSAPIRSMSFPGKTNLLSSGTEVDMPVGQIQAMLEAGYPEGLIREMLGLTPQRTGQAGPSQLMSGEIDPRQYGNPLTPAQQAAEDAALRTYRGG